MNIITLTFKLLAAASFSLAWTLCLASEADSSSSAANHIRWVLSLDSRSTIIERKHITINGALTGVRFGEKGHKITLGYYWLNYGSSQRLIDWHKKLAHRVNLSYYIKTDVRFVSMAYWYPIHRDKRWTVSLPAEIGLGQESVRYRQLADDGYLGKNNLLFAPYQLGIYSEYRFSPWVGFGLQVGYRDAISHGTFRRHFKGPYYSYGLTFYPDKIYTDLKTVASKRRSKN